MSENNRFQILDEQVEAFEAALEDPDEYGTPEQFLSTIEDLARQIHATTQGLTIEDFNAEYEEEDGEEEDAEIETVS